MKRLLLFAVLLISLSAAGQKTTTLPSPGTIQVQSYVSPDGKTRIGNAAKGFEVIALQRGLDSIKNLINAALLLKADTSTVVHRSGIENITGTKLFKAGLVANGVIGSQGTDRADAQFELNNNITGGHTLLSLHNNLPDDESAITYSSILSDGSIKQIGAGFARFVNGINTYNNYETVYGFHLPSYPKDNTPLLLYSNNSARLLGGSTTGSPWNNLPPDNTLDIAGDITQSGDYTITKSTPKINIVGTQSSGRSYTLTSSIEGVSNAGFSIRDNTSGVNIIAVNSGGDVKLSAKLNIGTTTDYADNAAALAGGLVAGDIYRTGDLLKVVH